MIHTYTQTHTYKWHFSCLLFVVLLLGTVRDCHIYHYNLFVHLSTLCTAIGCWPWVELSVFCQWLLSPTLASLFYQQGIWWVSGNRCLLLRFVSFQLTSQDFPYSLELFGCGQLRGSRPHGYYLSTLVKTELHSNVIAVDPGDLDQQVNVSHALYRTARDSKEQSITLVYDTLDDLINGLEFGLQISLPQPH